jgi:hypothetical protein
VFQVFNDGLTEAQGGMQLRTKKLPAAIARYCVCFLLAAAFSAAPSPWNPAYSQPGPAADEGKEDKPLEVPVSPEEKKALEEQAGPEKADKDYDEIVLKDGTKINGS